MGLLGLNSIKNNEIKGHFPQESNEQHPLIHIDFTFFYWFIFIFVCSINYIYTFKLYFYKYSNTLRLLHDFN